MDDNTSSILYLNDDCILNIFNFLQLKDQIILAAFNKRLKNIYYLYLKKKKSYNLDLCYQKWSLEEIYIAFHLIGPIIEEFEIIKTSEEIPRLYVGLDFVLDYCTNLTNLKVENVNVNHQIEQVSKSFQNLETLTLKNCSLIDDNIKKLSNLIKIKHIDFSRNDKISGKHFEHFQNLEMLVLNDCTQILTENMALVFQNTKNLRYFDLEQVTNFDDLAIGKLIDNCKNLETLKIFLNFRGVLNLKQIPQLKNLKHLSITEKTTYSLSVFETRKLRDIIDEILDNLKNQLKSLKINCCQFYHDNGLNTGRFETIYKMKKLKELHLIGYLSSYVVNWKDLGEFASNSDLEILNLTYSNPALGFSSEDFVNFLINANTLSEVNLTYSNLFSYPRFLYSFIEQLDNRKIKPIFTLRINVDKNLKYEIINKAECIAAKDFFKLELNFLPSVRHNYYGRFGYMDYEDNGDFDPNEMIIDESDCQINATESENLKGMKIILNSKLV